MSHPLRGRSIGITQRYRRAQNILFSIVSPPVDISRRPDCHAAHRHQLHNSRVAVDRSKVKYLNNSESALQLIAALQSCAGVICCCARIHPLVTTFFSSLVLPANPPDPTHVCNCRTVEPLYRKKRGGSLSQQFRRRRPSGGEVSQKALTKFPNRPPQPVYATGMAWSAIARKGA